jgi:hypothetical protein
VVRIFERGHGDLRPLGVAEQRELRQRFGAQQRIGALVTRPLAPVGDLVFLRQHEDVLLRLDPLEIGHLLLALAQTEPNEADAQRDDHQAEKNRDRVHPSRPHGFNGNIDVRHPSLLVPMWGCVIHGLRGTAPPP